MEKIVKVWFDANRIFIMTDAGETLSRPLEAFPVLMEATEQARLDFKIGRFGDDIRWEGLDEDIHVSSFHEKAEPNPDIEIGEYLGNKGGHPIGCPPLFLLMFI